MKNKSIKRIKIQRQYRYSDNQGYFSVSSIYLSGKWLRETGFHPTDYVGILVDRNCLIIRKPNDYKQKMNLL